jgi:hypothetical protein
MLADPMPLAESRLQWTSPASGRRFEALVRAGGWPEYRLDPDGWPALASALVGAEFRDAEDVHREVAATAAGMAAKHLAARSRTIHYVQNAHEAPPARHHVVYGQEGRAVSSDSLPVAPPSAPDARHARFLESATAQRFR